MMSEYFYNIDLSDVLRTIEVDTDFKPDDDLLALPTLEYISFVCDLFESSIIRFARIAGGGRITVEMLSELITFTWGDSTSDIKSLQVLDKKAYEVEIEQGMSFGDVLVVASGIAPFPQS